MAALVEEILPPSLDATAEQPPLLDGTTRLYTAYICPYAQRVWITRNYKGLQDKIKLVPLNLYNRPDWYKEKVYPANKVPALEHNGKVIGESLDLIKYVDENFEGPSLLPNDPSKREYAEELLSYSDKFIGTMISSFKGETAKEAGAQFDYLENALQKFDGPFILGEISQVDIAYIPFVERLQVFLLEAFKIDITEGRPKLAAWIEEFNKMDAYKQTIPSWSLKLIRRNSWVKNKRWGDCVLPCMMPSNKSVRHVDKKFHYFYLSNMLSSLCTSVL